MSGGIIVVAVIAGALALGETVLPRAFSALRKWQRQAKAERAMKRKRLPAASEDLAQADVAATAQNAAPERPLPVPADDAKSEKTNDAALEPSGGDVVKVEAEQNDEAQAEAPLAVAEDAESAHQADDGDLRLTATDANQLWEEARGMEHCFLPDPEKDREYLAKIYGAARLGHLEAMAKLGEYASRRGAVVEAYYWTALAELKGATGLGASLRAYKSSWMSAGCPPQYGNVYDEFTEMQGSFARALLRIRSAVNAPQARARMRELAERGCDEAKLFLER